MMKRLTAGFALIVIAIACCLAAAGCSTVRKSGTPDSLQSTSFWQPYLLYQLASPHDRLYVEVDAVEGCVPSDETLNHLRDFLVALCNKPGGVEIVRSDLIPAKAAQGIAPRALAREYLTGPPTNSAGASPAFLYVLFFDGTLSDKPAVVTTTTSGTKSKGASYRKQNPHVDLLPYPAAIFINKSYSGKLAEKWIKNEILMHEAGHVLGLAGRTTNAADYHCLDKTCIMNKSLRVHIGRVLLGLDPNKQHQLCKNCLAQLAGNAGKSPPSNLRFVGPVIVRSENGYHVLSLPFRTKVIVGDLADQDCREFAQEVHSETPGSSDDDWRVSMLVKDESLARSATTNALNRAKADPLEPVRLGTSRAWTQICASRYSSAGQFANAVEVYRQAVLSDPHDDSSYNNLAWIKATCPDPSVRDGNEAVAAAEKACKLTAWKQWNWIDTLAAAYAELGDFKAAVRFEQLALRTSKASESDQKGMQERIALYEQSKPYREKP